jgi:HD-like signal output (HDOD) protein
MWDLPADLAGIIGYHHRPAKAPENARLMAALVHVADAVCRQLGIGKPGDELVPVIDGTLLEFLKIHTALLDWMPEIQEKVEKSEVFLTALGAS